MLRPSTWERGCPTETCTFPNRTEARTRPNPLSGSRTSRRSGAPALRQAVMVSSASRSMAFAEFTLPRAPASDRRSPQRWIASHVARHAWIVAMLLVGAVGNAALAAVVPPAIGQGFNLGLGGNADAAGPTRLALIILLH